MTFSGLKPELLQDEAGHLYVRVSLDSEHVETRRVPKFYNPADFENWIKMIVPKMLRELNTAKTRKLSADEMVHKERSSIPE